MQIINIVLELFILFFAKLLVNVIYLDPQVATL
jgi:hypothetical protein